MHAFDIVPLETDLLASRRSRSEAAFLGGSFDRSGAGLKLREEWQTRREVQSDWGDFRNPHTTATASWNPTWDQAAMAKRNQQRLPQWY